MFPRRIRGRLALVAAFAVAITATACQDDAESPLAPEIDVEPEFGWLAGRLSSRGPFRVYTQNVYLGGDTGPLFNGLDFSDIVAVLGATNQFWGEVQASDAPARVSEIVNEIERRRPHVVSLQEVLQFVTIDATTGQPSGGLDLLALIEAELAARGLGYEVEIVQEGTSSMLPLSVDFTTGQPLELLSFTDRIALLRHHSVDMVGEAHGQYGATFALGPVQLIRGWGRVSVTHRGVHHHVIGTHLEVQSILPIHSAQADELQNVVTAGLEGVVIIAGDLNSDAAAAEGDESWTPTYENLIAAGYVDTWAASRASRRSDGFTCCQHPSLREENQLHERIDFVLSRSTLPERPRRHRGDDDEDDDDDDDDRDDDDRRRVRSAGIFRADVVGDETRDRTESGLWPSDHAGVFASILYPGRWR